MLQAVFRRAGARGLIYDFLLLSCGIRLLMFQPCSDRILICLIRSLIYYTEYQPTQCPSVWRFLCPPLNFRVTLYKVSCSPPKTKICDCIASLKQAARCLRLSVCVSLSPPQIPLQKLLFSATLSQNPEKLQLLDLHQPRLFSSTHRSTETGTQSQDTFNFPQGLAVSRAFLEHCNQTPYDLNW